MQKKKLKKSSKIFMRHYQFSILNNCVPKNPNLSFKKILLACLKDSNILEYFFLNAHIIFFANFDTT